MSAFLYFATQIRPSALHPIPDVPGDGSEFRKPAVGYRRTPSRSCRIDQFPIADMAALGDVVA